MTDQTTGGLGMPPNLAPNTQPLLQAGDVKFLGTLALPSGWLPNALCVDGDLLHVGIYGGGKCGIASARIPASGIGNTTVVNNYSALPNLAKMHRGGTYTDIIPGGLLTWAGKLIAAGWTYYDGSGGQVKSHWGGVFGSMNGPYAMQVTDVLQNYDNTGRMSMVGGYMGTIPPEWRSAFGFNSLSGQCCIPIISRSSYGPSVSAFNAESVGVTEPIPSKMLVGYPYEHTTLGAWEANPPGTYYGGTDQLGSVGFPSGTRSVVFTGRHGDNFCYGPGTSNLGLVGTPGPGAYKYCYDPFDGMQGNHGPPYRPTMWAYDANDLLLVKQGSKKPWEVFPYAKWTLPGMAIDQPYYLRAGWYDDTKRRYYVGDTSSPNIFVFSIGLGSGVPPPTPVNCIGSWGGYTRVAGSETVCVGSVRNYQERRDYVIITPGSGGGTPCPPPEFRTLTEPCIMPPPPTQGKLIMEVSITKSNDPNLPIGGKLDITEK